MTPIRIIGTILLVAGVAVLIVGVNASNSFVDQLHNTFTGRFTDKTTWYIIGGVTGAVVGLLMLAFGGGRSTGSGA